MVGGRGDTTQGRGPLLLPLASCWWCMRGLVLVQEGCMAGLPQVTSLPRVLLQLLWQGVECVSVEGGSGGAGRCASKLALHSLWVRDLCVAVHSVACSLTGVR